MEFDEDVFAPAEELVGDIVSHVGVISVENATVNIAVPVGFSITIGFGNRWCLQFITFAARICEDSEPSDFVGIFWHQ